MLAFLGTVTVLVLALAGAGLTSVLVYRANRKHSEALIEKLKADISKLTGGKVNP